MQPWVNNQPNYTSYPLPEFVGNPLIEALTPLPFNQDDAIMRLSSLPLFDEAELKLPAVLRMFLPARLSRFLFPTTQHVRFLNHLAIQIFDGYSTRNPLSPAGQQYLHHAASQSYYVPVIDPGTGRLSTISMVCGIPGIGKSTLIRGCMSMLGKPVIRHSNYNGTPFPEAQILYLMRNVPDQCSAKPFCKAYGDYTDALLGMPLYAKFFADKSMTRSHYVGELRKIVVSHHVGALILDCVEHLLLGSANDVAEFMAMLINMRDELRVPIILVGTPRAADILKSDVSTSRRIVEGGYHELKRPESPEDPDFAALSEVLWGYQWVTNRVEFSEGMRDLLYDLSQGITGVMITLFIAAQIEAIDSGKETLTKDLIKGVYDQRFKPLHSILDALRSGKQSIISQYDDLYPKAFSGLKADPLLSRIEEIHAQMAAKQELSLGIMDEVEKSVVKEEKERLDAATLLQAVTASGAGLPQALL